MLLYLKRDPSPSAEEIGQHNLFYGRGLVLPLLQRRLPFCIEGYQFIIHRNFDLGDFAAFWSRVD